MCLRALITLFYVQFNRNDVSRRSQRVPLLYSMGLWRARKIEDFSWTEDTIVRMKVSPISDHCAIIISWFITCDSRGRNRRARSDRKSRWKKLFIGQEFSTKIYETRCFVCGSTVKWLRRYDYYIIDVLCASPVFTVRDIVITHPPGRRQGFSVPQKSTVFSEQKRYVANVEQLKNNEIIFLNVELSATGDFATENLLSLFSFLAIDFFHYSQFVFGV